MSKMGDRICQMRKMSGLTMQELADKLGIQHSAVNKYEKGLVENIPRATIANMAKLFDCSPAWLMGFDEEEEKDPLLRDINHQASSMDEEQLRRLLEYAMYLKFLNKGKEQ